MLPGRGLKQELRIHPFLFQGLLPEFPGKMFSPGIEKSPFLKGIENNRPESLIPPGQNPFQKTLTGIIPFDLDMLLFKAHRMKLSRSKILP